MWLRNKVTCYLLWVKLWLCVQLHWWDLYNLTNLAFWCKQIQEEKKLIMWPLFWPLGMCMNCEGNTQGSNCEECMPGFYRRPGTALTEACVPCPCSNSTSTGTCHTGQSLLTHLAQLLIECFVAAIEQHWLALQTPCAMLMSSKTFSTIKLENTGISEIIAMNHTHLLTHVKSFSQTMYFIARIISTIAR